jgi:hypothetical protein
MVKILVSLDERLLERLDEEATSLGLSRSALIGRLAAAALGESLGQGARPEAHGALDRLKVLFREVRDPVDPTQVIRQMRDNR